MRHRTGQHSLDERPKFLSSVPKVPPENVESFRIVPSTRMRQKTGQQPANDPLSACLVDPLPGLSVSARAEPCP